MDTPSAAATTAERETATASLLREFLATAAARDWEGHRRLYAAGFRGIDRRRTVLQPLSLGQDGGVETVRSMFSPDTDVEVEVLVEDERVQLQHARLAGSGPGGVGAFEAEWLAVWLVTDGRLVRSEGFDVADEASARERAAELMRTPAVALLHRESAEAFRARDWDALGTLYAEHHKFTDRRTLGGESAGRFTPIPVLRSVAEQYPDIDVEDEILDADDHTALVHSRWRGHAADGGGEVEYELLEVGSGREGLIDTTDWFAPEHEAEAWVRLAELRAAARLAEVSGRASAERVDTESPVLATALAVIEAINRREWDAARALWADDAVCVDHRLLGRGTVDADGWLESVRLWDDLGDWVIGLREVWFIDDEGGLCVVGYAGRSADGGVVDLEYLMAARVLDGRLVRQETYDPEDAARAWGRMRELGADAFAVELARVRTEVLAAGGLVPSQALLHLATQYAAAVNVPDFARLRKLLHPGFVARDHRLLAAPDYGPDEQVERTRMIHDLMPGARLVGREWLQVGADHVLLRIGFEMTHDDGAHTEFEWLGRLTYRDGRVFSLDTFDVDAIDEARAWSAPPAVPESFRLTARDAEAHAARDWAADLEIFAPAMVLHDNRLVGTGPLGRDAFLAQRYGLVRLAPDVSLRYVEAWEPDDVAMAGRVIVTGTNVEGGAFEWELVGTVEVAAGRIVRMAWWDVEHAERARAWCMCAQVAPGAPLDDVPAWRGLRNWIAAINMGEERAERPHHAARCRLVDVLEHDDHVLLARLAWVWTSGDDAPLEQPFLALTVTADDRVQWLDTLEADDEHAARERFAVFARQWRAVTAVLPDARPGSPMHRATFAHLAGIAARDWDLVASVYPPDAVFVDHRQVGFGTLTREQQLDRVQGLSGLSPDARWEVLETLASGERSCLLRSRWTGTDVHGGGFEIGLLIVLVVAPAGCERIETFEPEDEAGARARLLELSRL